MFGLSSPFKRKLAVVVVFILPPIRLRLSSFKLATRMTRTKDKGLRN